MSQNESEVEKLSEEIHNLYQTEAKRQGDVRHKDEYKDLTENVKEFDRVIARFILEKLKEQEKESMELMRKGLILKCRINGYTAITLAFLESLDIDKVLTD